MAIVVELIERMSHGSSEPVAFKTKFKLKFEINPRS
jgi:hypothetical protein